MAKRKSSRKKLFREFSKMDKTLIKSNHLRNLTYLYADAKENYDIGRAELELLFFIYDLEFWTIQHVAQAMNKSEKQMRKKLIYQLVNKGFVYKHFDKLTPGNVLDHFFREETKMNYRVRYALSQKGRLFVTRMYKKMSGEEEFNVLPYEPIP